MPAQLYQARAVLGGLQVGPGPGGGQGCDTGCLSCDTGALGLGWPVLLGACEAAGVGWVRAVAMGLGVTDSSIVEILL